jgi:hypothetical protein
MPSATVARKLHAGHRWDPGMVGTKYCHGGDGVRKARGHADSADSSAAHRTTAVTSGLKRMTGTRSVSWFAWRRLPLGVSLQQWGARGSDCVATCTGLACQQGLGA